MRKPNLFIVGAARCGTSAMHEFLQQHPDIFMSQPKEPMFFGSDLPFGFRPEPPLEKYLSLFAAARDEKIAGESSVKYLYSKRAAHEIRECCGAARIIIMLRNPVDMMHSLHAHFLQWNFEDLADFGSAVAAEPARKLGRRLPANLVIPPAMLWYREMASFAEQVRRYLEVFGRENVHFMLYEEFQKDTALVYRKTLEFLGVRADFAPELRVINANRQTRSELVKKLVLNTRFAVWLATHKHSRYIGRACIRAREALDALKEWNTREAKRTPMDAALRRQLTQEFAPEVERLGALVGRDLSHWSRAA